MTLTRVEYGEQGSWTQLLNRSHRSQGCGAFSTPMLIQHLKHTKLCGLNVATVALRCGCNVAVVVCGCGSRLSIVLSQRMGP
jgi:hypothetical protein